MGWNMDDYEPVEDRIRAFYSEHPNGRILTELQHHNQDFTFVIFKATVYRDGDLPAAEGTAFETVSQRGVNATSHIENCETSAIGRALANLGYGAKGKRPSREEMQKVSDSAGSAPASASQSAPPAEPKAQASRSNPNHSEGGAAGPDQQMSSGAENPAPPSDHSQEGASQQVGSGTKSHSAGIPDVPPDETQKSGGAAQQGGIADPGAAVPPADESWSVIHAAVGRGDIKPVKVHMAAARICTSREGLTAPAKYEDVKDCPPEVLAQIVDELVAVKA